MRCPAVLVRLFAVRPPARQGSRSLQKNEDD
jgi:hypothetical protein